MVTKLMITIAPGAAPDRQGDKMKKVLTIVASFAFVLIAFAYTPSVTGLTLQDDTTAKQDIKDAGRSTKRAAKKLEVRQRKLPKRPLIRLHKKQNKALKKSKTRLGHDLTSVEVFWALACRLDHCGARPASGKKRAGAKVTAIKHLGNWLNYGMTAILVTG
jgi:hypothetical protein